MMSGETAAYGAAYGVVPPANASGEMGPSRRSLGGEAGGGSSSSSSSASAAAARLANFPVVHAASQALPPSAPLVPELPQSLD